MNPHALHESRKRHVNLLGALTTRSVQNIVKKYVRSAGITKAISPHSIRHTVGTNMAINEASLLVIQQFLGHSDPKTTLRYIRRAAKSWLREHTDTIRSPSDPYRPAVEVFPSFLASGRLLWYRIVFEQKERLSPITRSRG
jgi:hypothetical protein